MYKDVKVAEYMPDLICFEQIVVDTKTIDGIGDHEIGKMLNYLKITGLRVGLLLNFERAPIGMETCCALISDHEGTRISDSEQPSTANESSGKTLKNTKTRKPSSAGRSSSKDSIRVHSSPFVVSAEAARQHAEWWTHRIARQQEIDASIAAKADFEYLYGKPVEVEPMLALPGWMIKRRIGKGQVFVVNPTGRRKEKFFVHKRQVHSPQTIQQIAHQHEQLCRNVEPAFKEGKSWEKKSFVSDTLPGQTTRTRFLI